VKEGYMPNEHKEQQSLYLRESVVAAIRQIAELTGRSISAVADEFLEAQIERFRNNTVTLKNVRVLEDSLPNTMTRVDDEHPIFGGKPPRLVITELKSPLRYVP